MVRHGAEPRRPSGQPRPRYVAIFDRNGVPVWFVHSFLTPSDAKLLPNGHLAWGLTAGSVDTDVENEFVEYTLDGTLVRHLKTVGVTTNLHEMRLLSNGDYLLMSYVPRDHVNLSAYGGPADATVLDGVLQEVDPDGKLVWSWNSKDHISPEETARWYQAGVLTQTVKLPDGRTAYDLVHMNSAEEDGDSIVFSARHLDAVFKIDRDDVGAIQWKLGGTMTGKSLTIVGDGANADFGGQHDARVLGDGTLTLHDNGSGRGRPARALHFAIDPVARTATRLEAVTDPDAPYSPCCGSARRLSGGDWVATWGSNPYVTELTADGTRRFRLEFTAGYFTYRADPVEPGVLSAAALRAGMDAMHPR